MATVVTVPTSQSDHSTPSEPLGSSMDRWKASSALSPTNMASTSGARG